MHELHLVETTSFSQLEADLEAASVQQFAEKLLINVQTAYPVSDWRP